MVSSIPPSSAGPSTPPRTPDSYSGSSRLSPRRTLSPYPTLSPYAEGTDLPVITPSPARKKHKSDHLGKKPDEDVWDLDNKTIIGTQDGCYSRPAAILTLQQMLLVSAGARPPTIITILPYSVTPAPSLAS
jgi:hypothetical protein